MKQRYNAQHRAHNYYNNKKNPQTFQAEQPLSVEQVNELMTFADNYYKAWSDYTGVYTPYMTNQRLGEINLSSSKISEENLKKAFADPLNHQNELIGYSEFLKFTNSIAKRTFAYLGNMAAFDMSFWCKDMKDYSEYGSQEYKKCENVLANIVGRFDYKAEFSKIIKRMLDEDTYFSVFRTDANRIGFQELPSKFCKITGSNLDWGFLFDFDMNWFLKPGLSIDMYPPIFKKMYNDIFQNDGADRYNPANKLNERNGTWSLWTQTSPLPEDGGFTAFKWNDEMYANIPFITSLFNDAINGDIVRQLQNNQYIIASEKLLVGLIPMLKDPKSGQTKDMLAISPETMGKFLGALQNGLKEIQVKGVPFSDVKEVTYEMPNKSITDEYYTNASGQAGVTASFVYTSGARTATEIRTNNMIDCSMVAPAMKQFSKWFTTFVNHEIDKVGGKYHFEIIFEGTIFDRGDRFETAMKLADKGMVDFQRLAHAFGEDYFSFSSKLAMSTNGDAWKYLKLLPNLNTMSSGDIGSSGRPTVSIDESADSTERHLDRDVGGNE